MRGSSISGKTMRFFGRRRRRRSSALAIKAIADAGKDIKFIVLDAARRLRALEADACALDAFVVRRERRFGALDAGGNLELREVARGPEPQAETRRGVRRGSLKANPRGARRDLAQVPGPFVFVREHLCVSRIRTRNVVADVPRRMARFEFGRLSVHAGFGAAGVESPAGER